MDHGNAYAALACVQTLVRDWSSVPGEVERGCFSLDELSGLPTEPGRRRDE